MLLVLIDRYLALAYYGIIIYNFVSTIISTSSIGEQITIHVWGAEMFLKTTSYEAVCAGLFRYIETTRF